MGNDAGDHVTGRFKNVVGRYFAGVAGANEVVNEELM